MTELTAFLAALYDAFSEAEMQALQHGRTRLADLLESGAVPENVAVPVYHASEVQVTLDVGLVAEETDDGMEVVVTDADDADASELSFDVELVELLEKGDLDYGDAPPGPDRSDGGTRAGSTPQNDDPATESPDGRDPGESDRGADGGAAASADRSTIADESIDVIDGIDPEHREALKAIGIERVTDLVDRSPYALADAVGSEGTEVSPRRAADWLDEARGLIAILSEREGDLPVELVDGIGPVFGNRLREAGVAELSTLVERSPEEVAALVTSESVTVSPQRTARWIEEATTKLRALEQIEAVRDGPDDGDPTDEPDGDASTDEPGGTEDER
jgi:hypothetical protein